MENENKIQYLSIISEVISRMSTSSALFKGFAAMITSNIAMISYDNINVVVLTLSFVPVIVFFLLDAYYLNLEKRFRHLYDKVCEEDMLINYSMTPPTEKEIKAEAWKQHIEPNIGILYCIKSPSIWGFYIPLIMIEIVVIAMKFQNII